MASGLSATAVTLPASAARTSAAIRQADFLLGITGLAIHDQTFDGPVTGRRWTIWRPFVEDNWRVTPSLTLNLGLAWDMTTPITEAHGRLANYVPATGQLLIANQNGVSGSAGVNMDWTALEPRIGASLEGLRQRQDSAPRRLRPLPRLCLEPGCPGSVAEPALPGRIRCLPLRRLRLCNLVLRHRARTDPHRH